MRPAGHSNGHAGHTNGHAGHSNGHVGSAGHTNGLTTLSSLTNGHILSSKLAEGITGQPADNTIHQNNTVGLNDGINDTIGNDSTVKVSSPDVSDRMAEIKTEKLKVKK